MAKNIEFKAFLPVTTDIVQLWESVIDKKKCHLSGYDSRYVLSYSGPVEAGLDVLELILQLDDYEISFKSAKGG